MNLNSLGAWFILQLISIEMHQVKHWVCELIINTQINQLKKDK